MDGYDEKITSAGEAVQRPESCTSSGNVKQCGRDSPAPLLSVSETEEHMSAQKLAHRQHLFTETLLMVAKKIANRPDVHQLKRRSAELDL